jgi:hypothetical protein
VLGKPQQERRKERREMHIDRRKSDVDMIEHVIGGVCATYLRATSNDDPPRKKRRK